MSQRGEELRDCWEVNATAKSCAVMWEAEVAVKEEGDCLGRQKWPCKRSRSGPESTAPLLKRHKWP